MTVTATTRKKIYDGDNSTTVFPWDFHLTEEAQLKVYINDVNIPQGDATYPWSFSGTLPGATGNVTFTLNPPPTGTSNVLLVREMTFDQQTDYLPLDPFPAETHEAALDKLTMQSQEVNEETSRAIKTDINDESGADYTLPSPVADSVIAMWNPAGDALLIGPTANEISNAQANATAAAASAAAAAISETNAAASAAAAAASAASIEEFVLLDVPEQLNGSLTVFTGVPTSWTSIDMSAGGTNAQAAAAAGATKARVAINFDCDIDASAVVTLAVYLQKRALTGTPSNTYRRWQQIHRLDAGTDVTFRGIELDVTLDANSDFDIGLQRNVLGASITSNIEYSVDLVGYWAPA